MTDKEIPLSSKPYDDQNFKHEPEDEINLLDLLVYLFRKKFLILSIAAICIVLSICYAFLVTPIYRATIGFLPPEKSLDSFFPRNLHETLPNVVSDTVTGTISIKKNYMLNKFVSELQSYSNQEKVFMEGKFHERFVANNPQVDIKKKIVQEIYRSIHVSRTSGGLGKNGEGLAAKVVDYDMKGINPELASDYLNALADWVKNKVERDIQESIQKEAKVQIALLSAQLNSRITKEKLEYEDKIRVLTDNIEIAKNLGILGNNFDNFKPVGFEFHEKTKHKGASGSLSSTVVERIKVKAEIDWPVWYLYGQRALEHKLILLERRGVSAQYAKETTELISKIELLSGIDLSKINFDQVTISQPSIPPVYPTNIKKTRIIATGIVLGLFIGILIASLSCLITKKKDRNSCLDLSQ
jgi:LPS O-antigen subunit length determinant protein (WzzB/FepE family)